MTPEEKVRRAGEAAKIIENPLFTEAFARFLKDIENLRMQVSPRDLEGAHRLVLMEQTVTKARYLLESYIKDGDRAEKELEAEIVAPLDRLKRKFRTVV